jgi:HSP90 family molecular chaperone
VLVEAKSPDVLPDWMRFIKGVVDSEDLPLAISREKMQDSRLLVKIREVLTGRLIRFIAEKQKKERKEYEEFFAEFGHFLKEGCCTDFQNKDKIAATLLFESSKCAPGELTSMDEYISRCGPEQMELYYLIAPSRELAEMSPYYEAFKKSGEEVLFMYTPIDDFVMNNLQEFNKRKLVRRGGGCFAIGVVLCYRGGALL